MQIASRSKKQIIGVATKATKRKPTNHSLTIQFLPKNSIANILKKKQAPAGTQTLTIECKGESVTSTLSRKEPCS